MISSVLYDACPNRAGYAFECVFVCSVLFTRSFCLSARGSCLASVGVALVFVFVMTLIGLCAKDLQCIVLHYSNTDYTVVDPKHTFTVRR